jgi:peptide deformylase
MILPIYAYGKAILREKSKPIDKNFPQLERLIQDMFETMYNANGVGLAAPQVGFSIRLFIADGTSMKPNPQPDGTVENMEDFKKIFINPVILEQSGEPWEYEEGCLSIPFVREVIQRPKQLKIKYFDENWNEKIEIYDGLKARIIQHEYDHIEGILFIDHISPLRKQIIRGKLNKILQGKLEVDYPMVFK